jgi:hypothetical protein
VTGPLATSLISAAGALLVAVAGYVLTKRAEREAEWRKEKLAYYKEFVSSLSGTIANESTAEGQIRFSRACNDILLFAPWRVIAALDRFWNEIGASNSSKSLENHDKLLSELFFEIRRDIGVRPKDQRHAFTIRLRSSGVPTREKPGA